MREHVDYPADCFDVAVRDGYRPIQWRLSIYHATDFAHHSSWSQGLRHQNHLAQQCQLHHLLDMRRGLILLKPVDQTETDPGRGNCLTACLASIMDLGIDEVPYFRVYDDWWELLQEWLRGHGLFAIRVSACPDEVFPTPDVHCILTGLSPRNSV